MERTLKTIFFLTISAYSLAQPSLELSATEERIRLEPYINYYVDEEGLLSFEEISKISFLDSFKISEDGVLRFGITEACIWLRIPITNFLEYDKVYFSHFEDPSLYRITQFVKRPDGSVTELETGVSIQPRNKPVKGNQNSFPVSFLEGEDLELYYRIESKNFISLPLKLSSFDQYHEQAIYHRIGQGIFYGILLSILFYSLLSYFSTKSKIFLYFLLAVLFFGVITGTFDGTTPQFLYPLVTISGGYYDVYFSGLSNIFGLLFMSNFLHISTVSTWLDRVTKATIIAMIGIMLLALFQPALSLGLISMFTFPISIMVIVAGFIGVKRNISNARYYLAASLVLGISVSIAVLSLFEFIPISIFTGYILHAGILIWMVILSIGLGQRIKKFRMRLKQKELEKEIEKQKLIEEKNRELELKVKERTLDIQNKEINLRSILDNNSDDSIWLVDKQFRIIDFNKFFHDAIELVYGIEIKPGLNILELFPEDIKTVWKSRYENSLNGKTGEYIEELEIEGQKHIFEIKIYPIRDNDQITGVSVYSRNVTAMKNAEQKLKSQNESLTKVNEELDRFVYSASHDLKAPLASVLGLINITKAEKDPASTENYLDLMHKSVSKLNTFITDIESYARNTRTVIAREKVDLEILVKEVIQDLFYLEGVDKANVSISIEAKSEFFSDSKRLYISCANVINNALRYSIKHRGPEETKISVKGTVDEDQAILSIEDNGPGIVEDYHDKIFEMFFRVHDRISGTGLGLYIAKEALDKLQGAISVESKIDEGSVFTFTIPNMINDPAPEIVPGEVVVDKSANPKG